MSQIPQDVFGKSMTVDEPWNLDESIESEPAAGVGMIDLMLKKLTAFQWSDTEVFGIHMALEEAVMNAIKHGNQQADNKQVHIRATIDAQQLIVQVTDEGDGFDPDEVPDPTLDENLERTSGRGLMLMRHYMDSVEYNEIGNSVELRKCRVHP